eukprot:g5183.t1
MVYDTPGVSYPEERKSKPYSNKEHIGQYEIVKGATVQPGQSDDKNEEDTDSEDDKDEEKEGGKGKKKIHKCKKSTLEQIKELQKQINILKKKSKKENTLKKEKPREPKTRKEKQETQKEKTIKGGRNRHQRGRKRRGRRTQRKSRQYRQRKGRSRKELRGVTLKHFPTVDVALVSLDEKVPGMVGREGVLVGLDWLSDVELKKISVEELKMLEASKESLAKDAFGWKEKSPLMMLLRCEAHLECPKTILEKEKEKKKGSIVADPDEELPKGYFWLGVPFPQDPDVPEQAKIAFHEKYFCSSKAEAKYAEISDASKPQGSDSDEDEEQQQKAKGKQERGSDSDDDEKPLVAPRKGKQEKASRSEDDDDGDRVPPSRKGNKGKGRGKGKRKGKVCDQPWADGEDCVNGCITINSPEELHCDYKDYHRDDESEVPMKELVNGRGEVLVTYLGDEITLSERRENKL